MPNTSEFPSSLYKIYGSEIPGGVVAPCGSCGQPDAQLAATRIIYQPTEAGKFFGAELKSEIISGGHSGCKGNGG